MNTCLIAACAANARARRKEEPVYIPTEELYYKVTLRKYYYFKPLNIIPHFEPTGFPELSADVEIPAVAISPVTVDARTSAIATSFSVKESLCHNGIDEYIRNNLDRIVSTSEWKARHAQVITDYVYTIKNQYDVDIDPAYLTYTTEYYWEIK